MYEASYYEDDTPMMSSDLGTKPGGRSTDQQQSLLGQRKRETWRRLRSFHHYPRSGQPTISIARYDGDHTEPAGKLPPRWNSTLISPAHRPENHWAIDCQLAGDLSILLGLIAGCHSNKNAAIAAVNAWFPPSRGKTQWSGPASAEAETQMQRMEQSMSPDLALLEILFDAMWTANWLPLGAIRGMVTETFYDSRRVNAEQNLTKWERGENGPIIT